MLPPRLPSNMPTPNVLSAAPQLIRKDGQKQGPTIEAKAQIRFLLLMLSNTIIEHY